MSEKARGGQPENTTPGKLVTELIPILEETCCLGSYGYPEEREWV